MVKPHSNEKRLTRNSVTKKMVATVVDVFLVKHGTENKLRSKSELKDDFLFLSLEAYFDNKTGKSEELCISMITNANALHENFDTYVCTPAFLDKLRDEVFDALTQRGYTFESSKKEFATDGNKTYRN